MFNRAKGGFTLIELLIVVAIIAILAAIAVPNFLEAQVRSKVSRCKADMRTLATAYESYSVDWNKPPPGPAYGVKKMGWPSGSSANSDLTAEMAFALLTTPIAYITSRPRDPFTSQGSRQAMERSKYFQYQCFWNDSDASAKYLAVYGKGYTWQNHSVGPFLSYNVTDSSKNTAPNILSGVNTDGGPGLFVYDATNGTISSGLVMRTNKGPYTAPSS